MAAETIRLVVMDIVEVKLLVSLSAEGEDLSQISLTGLLVSPVWVLKAIDGLPFTSLHVVG